MTVTPTEVVETGIESGISTSANRRGGASFADSYSSKAGVTISLPEEARPSQPALQKLMVDCALLVNDRVGAIGDSVREMAEALYNCKKNVVPGQWRAFINSKAMKISAKDAQDLANSWAKLLRTEDRVTDEMAGSMSLRALNAFANADAEAKDTIINKLRSGIKPTEKLIRDISKGAEPKAKTEATPDKLKQEMTRLLNFAEEQSEAKDMMDTLRQMEKINTTLYSSNKTLAGEKDKLANQAETAQSKLDVARNEVASLKDENKKQSQKISELLKELAPYRVSADLDGVETRS